MRTWKVHRQAWRPTRARGDPKGGHRKLLPVSDRAVSLLEVDASTPAPGSTAHCRQLRILGKDATNEVLKTYRSWIFEPS